MKEAIMDRVCVGCGKVMAKMSERYELATNDGLAFVCKDCASEVGIKNMFAAAVVTKGKFLEKYVKLHPDSQGKLDDTLAYRAKKKEDLQKEIADMRKKKAVQKAISSKRSGCKKKEQKKCTCKSCGNIYYYSLDDEAINVANLFIGNYYTLNQVKDLKKCPKCGSRATEEKKVFFWIDKKGNCVDVEE